jgi:hypothetical protein
MAIELRNHLIRVADPVVRRGRQYDTSRNREWRIEPAESKTQRMYANSLHALHGNLSRFYCAAGFTDPIQLLVPAAPGE